MSEIRFARVFSDGAVLQRDRKIHIWGFAAPNMHVRVELAGMGTECAADDAGRFDAYFDAAKKGGPYMLSATDDAGNTVTGRDIMIGDVIVICGQSNMEFPMDRVRETYPREWDEPYDPLLRTFKIEENPLFGKTIPDVETGEWKSVSAKTIGAYSAVGYFTALHLRDKEDVAIGLVDITMGGAPIEAFMSGKTLEGFEEALSEAHRYADDAFLAGTLADNESNAAAWHEALDKSDEGLGKYEDGSIVLKQGKEIAIPTFFSDTELDGFIGSLWMARQFTVPDKYVGKPATLWFGTIVDFDFCYINGELIGNTEYTYPPRRYHIPEGLIRKGDNTIVFRIGVEKGFGRVTAGKLLGIVFGDDLYRITDGYNERVEGADHIEYLGGVWKYLTGARTVAPQDTVYVSWKPTALYNGMMAPLAGLSVRAFAFYQGESNCRNFEEYPELTERFAAQLRRMWGKDLPYICVELPEFDSRMEEITYDRGKAWRGLVKAQEQCTSIPGFYLVRSYGTGELNDLHPQRKEPIGEMIADIIASLPVIQ